MRSAQATIRFGLGRRGDEPLPADPAAWLRDQVTADDAAKFDPRLPNTADGLTVLREQYKLNLPPGQSLVAPLYNQDVRAQTEQLLGSTQPFRERLVQFWANHFTVSIRPGRRERHRRPVRARGDPPQRHGPVLRHAAGGDAASGDADVPRQPEQLRSPTARWAATSGAA